MKLTISEVSRQAGIHPDTVRALERRGLISAERDLNGWRRYSPAVVEQIKKLYATEGDGDDGPKRAA
jgi:DNA-binding transcriptional MerR regulator